MALLGGGVLSITTVPEWSGERGGGGSGTRIADAAGRLPPPSTSPPLDPCAAVLLMGGCTCCREVSEALLNKSVIVTTLGELADVVVVVAVVAGLVFVVSVWEALAAGFVFGAGRVIVEDELDTKRVMVNCPPGFPPLPAGFFFAALEDELPPGRFEEGGVAPFPCRIPNVMMLEPDTCNWWLPSAGRLGAVPEPPELLELALPMLVALPRTCPRPVNGTVDC